MESKHSTPIKTLADSHDLYQILQQLDLLQHRPLWWWPNSGTFEVLIGAVLTQNTTWKNVEKSLANLQGYTTLEAFLELGEADLKERIRPSGFYNQKAPRLRTIAKNIQSEFGTFQTFQKEVTRNWLLAQKGIGEESADSILNYACFRAEMVVDTYTKRLLKHYGIELKNYYTYKTYLQEGLEKYYDKTDLALHYARFHGMIVEYNKRKTNPKFSNV